MKTSFTLCVPIPAFIPRPLALQVLHNHSEIITLNSLVIDHRPTAAPQDAPADERSAAWYEITERIQVVPGLGKLGSSKIVFPGCFHNMPWGLQTHIHAPLGIDLKVAYKIAGEQYGVEDQEPRELGLAAVGAPAEGLYLRADVEVRCSMALSGFVKSQTQTALNEMVERIVKKAERLDASVLTSMIEEDKLKRQPTQKPMQMRSSQYDAPPVPTLPSGFAQQAHHLAVQTPVPNGRPRSLYEQSLQGQIPDDRPVRPIEARRSISYETSYQQPRPIETPPYERQPDFEKQPLSYGHANVGHQAADEIIEMYTPHEPKRQFSFAMTSENVPTLGNASKQWSSASGNSVTLTDSGVMGAYGGGEYEPPRSRRSSYLPPDPKSSQYVDVADVPKPLKTGAAPPHSTSGVAALRSQPDSYQDFKAQAYIAEINGTKTYRVV